MKIGVFGGSNGDIDKLDRALLRFGQLEVDDLFGLGNIYGTSTDARILRRLITNDIHAVRGPNELSLTWTKLGMRDHIKGDVYLLGTKKPDPRIEKYISFDPTMPIIRAADHNELNGTRLTDGVIDPYANRNFQLTSPYELSLRIGQEAILDDDSLTLLTDALVITEEKEEAKALSIELNQKGKSTMAAREFGEGVKLASSEFPHHIIIGRVSKPSSKVISVILREVAPYSSVINNRSGIYSAEALADRIGD